MVKPSFLTFFSAEIPKISDAVAASYLWFSLVPVPNLAFGRSMMATFFFRINFAIVPPANSTSSGCYSIAKISTFYGSKIQKLN